MDVSALESDIEILSKRAKSLDHWLLFWTALVVLGLLVEVGMIVKEFLYPFAAMPVGNWRHCTIRPQRRQTSAPKPPSGEMIRLENHDAYATAPSGSTGPLTLATHRSCCF